MTLGNFFGHEKPDTISEPDEQAHPAHSGELEKAASVAYDDGDDRVPHPIDPIMEKRLLRKMDRNIIPLVMALCMMCTRYFPLDKPVADFMNQIFSPSWTEAI